MKRTTFSLLLIGLLLMASLLFAVTALSPKVEADIAAVDAANQLYTAGHYAEAIQLYETEVARGVQDSVLFFNLGNAYFQQGDIGRAVLNLERAAQLDPRDSDIANNLNLLREQTTELFVEEPIGPLAVLANSTGWLTQNETAILVLGFWFLLGFLVLIWSQIESYKLRRSLKLGMAILLIMLLLAGASLASRTFLQQAQPAGVIVAPTVAVSNGPGVEFVTDLSLTSGTTVNISETQGDWVRLITPQGSGETWLPSEAIEPITDSAFI